MGEDPGLWYSNWHHASLVARQLVQEVEALADGSEGSGGSEGMPRPVWRVGYPPCANPKVPNLWTTNYQKPQSRAPSKTLLAFFYATAD